MRKTLNLTQGEFAEKIGLKFSALSMIEREQVPITEQILIVCFVFNVSETWLRAGRGDMFMPDTSNLEEEFFKLFRQLTPEMQNAIFEHVETLLHIQQLQQNPIGL
ncbi:MAG: helix-turn-helix transcriptional regulator [Treponema sp.]|nr:helix-turn-helix transcriptional regulator [Treponema sp.]